MVHEKHKQLPEVGDMLSSDMTKASKLSATRFWTTLLASVFLTKNLFRIFKKTQNQSVMKKLWYTLLEY